MEIAVLLTCHNRREKTLGCLASLFRQGAPKGNILQVYLVDDGSTDGTAAAVRSKYPSVNLIPGDGTLYWNGGMRRAFIAAKKNDPDFFLWLNDDVTLYKDTLIRLLSTCNELFAAGQEAPIVVGTMQDPEILEPSYGGVRHYSRWHPMKYRLVPPTEHPQPCDTFNGNCVLVSRNAAKRVGNLDPAFTHNMGDFDYGLRAGRLGCSCWVAPEFVGLCRRGGTEGTWHDPRSPLIRRWQSLRDVQGFPPKEFRVYLRRHAGRLWFFYWLCPYLRTLILPLLPRRHFGKGEVTSTGKIRSSDGRGQ